MRRRGVLKFVIAVAVLLMLLPPLLDTFDSWDKRPEIPLVGHNTETTLVAVTAELGLCLVVAWSSVLFLNWLAVAFVARAIKVSASALHPVVRATDYLLLLFSPPWRLTSLRI